MLPFVSLIAPTSQQCLRTLVVDVLLLLLCQPKLVGRSGRAQSTTQSGAGESKQSNRKLARVLPVTIRADETTGRLARATSGHGPRQSRGGSRASFAGTNSPSTINATNERHQSRGAPTTRTLAVAPTARYRAPAAAPADRSDLSSAAGAYWSLLAVGPRAKSGPRAGKNL